MWTLGGGDDFRGDGVLLDVSARVELVFYFIRRTSNVSVPKQASIFPPH